jgi:hypothetical protein
MANLSWRKFLVPSLWFEAWIGASRFLVAAFHPLLGEAFDTTEKPETD